MSRRHRLVIPAPLAGLRLDRCLAELVPEWSRSRARKLIDHHRVTVAGRVCKPSDLVVVGDVVEVDEDDPTPATAEPEAIPLDILYEDGDLLAVNKPPGLVIHPAAGNPAGTLVNALLHHCRDLSGIGGVERPGIVHRLDKDTSGLILVAKNDRTHQGLSLAFRWRRVHKTYLAVCYGHPTGEEVVDAPIERHASERQRMAVRDGGREARTVVRLQEHLVGTSVVNCHPVTGRTHQIRVHMAHIGHALVGDPLYAGRQWRGLADPARAACCRAFPRQALHAWKIAFVHPVSELEMELEAPVPADLSQLIAALRSS